MIEKLKKLGKNAVKILDVQDNYLLTEMKRNNPPYRLYIIIDQKNDIYYITEWEHKKEQEKIISELKQKLSLAIKTGLENVFT